MIKFKLSLPIDPPLPWIELSKENLFQGLKEMDLSKQFETLNFLIDNIEKSKTVNNKEVIDLYFEQIKRGL